jgi:hypothetical protein
MSSRLNHLSPSSWSLALVLTGAVLVAACSRSDNGRLQTADASRDLTMAPRGSVSPELAIAPDEVFGTRPGRSTSTVHRRMLVHETSGPDLAATPTAATLAPAAATIAAVVPVAAAAMNAAPRPGHVAVVGSLAGDASSRSDPAADPANTGPYNTNMGGSYGGWGGPVIRGGSAGDDHCEKRVPGGFGGGGGMGGGIGPTFFAPGAATRLSY